MGRVGGMWSAHAHTHRRARRDACSLRMVGGVVVTRHPMGTGFLRTERSIPSAFSGTFAPDKQGRSCTPAVEEGDERAPGIYSLSFFPPLGRESSCVSSPLISAKMSVGCVILACTLLVGTSAVRPVFISNGSPPPPPSSSPSISRFAVPRQVPRRAASP